MRVTSSEQNRLSREKVDRTVGRRLFNERLSHDREGQIRQYVKQEWLSSVLCTVSWKCCIANMQEDCRDRGIFSEGKPYPLLKTNIYVKSYCMSVKSQKHLFSNYYTFKVFLLFLFAAKFRSEKKC